MDVQDFLILIAKAHGANRSDRANAARILTHAFPLVTWEPGDGDCIVRGVGQPPMANFCLEIRRGKPSTS